MVPVLHKHVNNEYLAATYMSSYVQLLQILPSQQTFSFAIPLKPTTVGRPLQVGSSQIKELLKALVRKALQLASKQEDQHLKGVLAQTTLDQWEYAVHCRALTNLCHH